MSEAMHDPYSPSKLAMWQHCAFWDSAGGGDAAARGTRIHKLVEALGTGGDASMYPDPEEAGCARRCLDFLTVLTERHATGSWEHETWCDGVVPETGGTIDAWARGDGCLVLVDWKATDVEPDSMQGKAYALNLAEKLMAKLPVYVYFYNYNTGAYTTAMYADPFALTKEISDLKAKRQRADELGIGDCRPFHGCAHCKHQATCKDNMSDTEKALSVPNNTEVMDISQMVQTWERLKPLLKRAKALSDALESKIMEATVGGRPTGYKVAQKAAARKWAAEDNFISWTSEYADKHFLTVPGSLLYGLRSPAEVERRLVEMWGADHTQEIKDSIAGCTVQPTYETLTKEKA